MKTIIFLAALMPAVAMAEGCGEFAQEIWQAASYRDMHMPPQSAAAMLALGQKMTVTNLDHRIITAVYFRYPNWTPQHWGRFEYKACIKYMAIHPNRTIKP